MALTNLDVLGYLDEIPICYTYQIDDEQTLDFPSASQLERAVPIYKKLSGWMCDISHVRSFHELPKQAQDYVISVENLIGVPIRWISIGPKREQIIERTVM
ncbi:Adenylosuccinate synthetase [compost metagenome]